MRKLMMLVMLGAVLVAGNALAVIGWAGNVWPNSGADVVPTGPVNVYAQVWKAGVTDAAGQGAGIEAFLEYTTDIAAMVSVAMTYNTDVGSNDEYTAQVPQAALVGAAYVDVHVRFHDLEDDTWYEDTNDQAGNPTPQRYNVVPVLPNDVDVTFSICLDATTYTGAPCVIGSADEIGAWVTGVTMTPDGTYPDLFNVTVTFLAGDNPSFEYKYKKDDCATWEGTANRAVTLPTDGTTAVTLDVDTWEFAPLGCGLGNVLTDDLSVCFQVCMEGVDNSGGVCVIGSAAEIGNWGTGVNMWMIGPDLWQICVTFPAGTAVPLNVEYKYKKDACNTWETVGNRTVVVDNGLGPEIMVTNGWDDMPVTCAPVATEQGTWGGVKSTYR